MPLPQSNLQRLRNAKTRVDRLVGQRDLLQSQLEATTLSLGQMREEVELLTRVEQVLMGLGSSLRAALKEAIEPLCTTAMQDVWGPEAGFEIQFEQTGGGRHKATIVTRSEHFQGPPADTDGDSVAELLSLVIRITLTVLHYPQMAPLLVMDEPLSALDTKNLPAVGSLLKDVCEDLEERGIPLQMVFTAHHLAPMLEPWAANVMTVVKKNGKSKVVSGLDPGTYGEGYG